MTTRISRKPLLEHARGWKIDDIFAAREDPKVLSAPTLHFSRNVHAANAPDPIPGVKAPLPLHLFMRGGGSLHIALHLKKDFPDLRVWDLDCEIFGTSSQEGLRGLLLQGLPRPLLLPVLESEWLLQKSLLRCSSTDLEMDLALQPVDPSWTIRWPTHWIHAETKPLLEAVSEDLVSSAATIHKNSMMLAGWNSEAGYFYGLARTRTNRLSRSPWHIVSPVGLGRLASIRTESEGVSEDGLFWKGHGWILRIPLMTETLGTCPFEGHSWPAREAVALLPSAMSGRLPEPKGGLKEARACLTGKDKRLTLELIIDGTVRLAATRRLMTDLAIPFSRWVSYRMLYHIWRLPSLHLVALPQPFLLFYVGDEALVLRATSI